jgi:hypothetical protein
VLGLERLNRVRALDYASRFLYELPMVFSESLRGRTLSSAST